MHEHFWLTMAEQRGAELRAEAAHRRRLRAAVAGRSRGCTGSTIGRQARVRLRGA